MKPMIFKLYPKGLPGPTLLYWANHGLRFEFVSPNTGLEYSMFSRFCSPALHFFYLNYAGESTSLSVTWLIVSEIKSLQSG